MTRSITSRLKKIEPDDSKQLSDEEQWQENIFHQIVVIVRQ